MKPDAVFFKNFMEKAKILLISVGVSVLLTFIFLAIFAFVMQKGMLSSSVEGIGLIVMSVLSCLFGGYLCGKKNREKRYLWGMLTGFCYCLIFVLIHKIAGGKSGGDLLSFLTTLLYCTAGGMLGGMLGL